MRTSSYRSGGFGGGFGAAITPRVRQLLIANGVMFLITFAFPTLVLDYLALQPSRILVRPWTPLTYMFVHGGFMHLLFNMLALFFFGPPLEDRWGSRDFLKMYLVAGLGGALLSFALPGGSVVGASGAVYGVMLAFAMIWPESPIYIWGIFPIKAKWLVAIMVATSVFLLIGGGASNVAHLAHLGGLAAAFLWIRSPWGPSAWGSTPTPARKPTPKKADLGARVRKTLHLDGGGAAQAPQDRKREEALLDDVDRILDKISQTGLHSLTPEERRVLDEASRRYRTN